MKNVAGIKSFKPSIPTMTKKFCFGFLGVLAAITLAAGCKPKAPARTTAPPRYFQTPFQS